MRFWRYALCWVALCLAVLAVWFFGGENRRDIIADSSPSPAPSAGAENVQEEENILDTAVNELRGVWIPYMSLSTEEHTQEAFEQNFRKIADSAREKGLNAVFVHVRSFAHRRTGEGPGV